MIRDFGRLADDSFDLLVVGGGIFGAWVAYDASLRGMKVAVIERDDWAAGTSSASSKLIHGGLRYLEQARFGLVRKALLERGRLFRLGPHRIRPVRFLLPIYDDTRVAAWKLRLGLWAYDRLAGRNRQVETSRRLDAEGVRREYPFLARSGLKSGFTYCDAQTDDARLTLELVDGAVANGAVALNRARATELLVLGSAVAGARVEDTETGEAVRVRAAVTANCAGPWGQSLVETALPSSSKLVRCSKGVHLVLPPLPSTDGLLLLTRRHGGVVFMIPWYGKTLVGTTDTDFTGNPDRLRLESDEIEYLLEQANGVVDGAAWTERDVISGFAGLRALPVTPDGSPSSVSRELAIEEPLSSLVMPVGGKITSARIDAARVVDRIADRLGRSVAPCTTGLRPFPWSPAEPYRRWLRATLAQGLELGLDEETVESCQQRYGVRVTHLFKLVADAPELARRIDAEIPGCLAEALFAVKHEMAMSLEDVVRRRMPLALVARTSQVDLFRVADLIGSLLGWTDERKHDEVATVFRQPASYPEIAS